MGNLSVWISRYGPLNDTLCNSDPTSLVHQHSAASRGYINGRCHLELRRPDRYSSNTPKARMADGLMHARGWNLMAKQKTLHEKLRELGNNLWWSWQPEVTQIFREIDPKLWTECGHNPVLLLEQYPPDTLVPRPQGS